MFLSTILAASAAASKTNPLVTFAPIILIGVVMYFLLIRPQRRRQREAMGLLKQLAEGDEVITNGGIYGFINAIDGDTIWLDIADGVEIRIHRSSVSRKVDPAKEPAGGPLLEDTGTPQAPTSRFTKFQKAAPKTAATQSDVAAGGTSSDDADPTALDAPTELGSPSELDGPGQDDIEK